LRKLQLKPGIVNIFVETFDSDVVHELVEDTLNVHKLADSVTVDVDFWILEDERDRKFSLWKKMRRNFMKLLRNFSIST
jgi:hypothetical protein